MKFEVLDRFGKRIFWTEHASCVPDEEIQSQLLDTGYKIHYNDKHVTSPVTAQDDGADATASG